jgi:hypothetical protein
VHGEFQNRSAFVARIAILLGSTVRDLAVLFLHLLATVAQLADPGGARSVVAESLLVKYQLLIATSNSTSDQLDESVGQRSAPTQIVVVADELFVMTSYPFANSTSRM